jgi:pheromone shutdown protein TraB
VLTLVGVGHVFDLARQVREVILSRRPSVVGLELDRARFAALQQGGRRGGPPLYFLLSVFQKRVADMYGGSVGDEMLAAAQAAKDVGARVALLDRDSLEMFRAWMGGMPVRERLKFFASLFTSLFVTKERVEAELAKYDADQAGYLEVFAQELPHSKKVLIDDRNAHMAAELRSLLAVTDRVVAVVGDGHIEGIRRHLADVPLEVIPLRVLRSGSPPPAPATGDGQGVTFSYDVGGGT